MSKKYKYTVVLKYQCTYDQEFEVDGETQRDAMQEAYTKGLKFTPPPEECTFDIVSSEVIDKQEIK